MLAVLATISHQDRPFRGRGVQHGRDTHTLPRQRDVPEIRLSLRKCPGVAGTGFAPHLGGRLAAWLRQAAAFIQRCEREGHVPADIASGHVPLALTALMSPHLPALETGSLTPTSSCNLSQPSLPSTDAMQCKLHSCHAGAGDHNAEHFPVSILNHHIWFGLNFRSAHCRMCSLQHQKPRGRIQGRAVPRYPDKLLLEVGQLL